MELYYNSRGMGNRYILPNILLIFVCYIMLYTGLQQCSVDLWRHIKK
jgi:hypothetical protein